MFWSHPSFVWHWGSYSVIWLAKTSMNWHLVLIVRPTVIKHLQWEWPGATKRKKNIIKMFSLKWKRTISGIIWGKIHFRYYLKLESKRWNEIKHHHKKNHLHKLAPDLDQHYFTNCTVYKTLNSKSKNFNFMFADQPICGSLFWFVKASTCTSKFKYSLG